jgi:hypothetical protein
MDKNSINRVGPVFLTIAVMVMVSPPWERATVDYISDNIARLGLLLPRQVPVPLNTGHHSMSRLPVVLLRYAMAFCRGKALPCPVLMIAMYDNAVSNTVVGEPKPPSEFCLVW